jgi:hypothetical protein
MFIATSGNNRNYFSAVNYAGSLWKSKAVLWQ